MKLIKNLSKLLLVVVLLSVVPLSVVAKSVESQIDYVALGDSLAAGITPNNVMDLGYPEYLEKRFEQSQYSVELKNFGYPGHKTTDLLELLNNQLVQAAIMKAELITIDIGANDVLPVIQQVLLQEALLQQNPQIIKNAINDMYQNLHFILARIDLLTKNNPNAKVYVMGYYNPFPYASLKEQTFLQPLLDDFNKGIKIIAENNGDTYVPTAKVIAENYQTYLPNPENIHLSLEGYKAVAKEFWKALDIEFWKGLE